MLAFSPDGRWIAFRARENGRLDVFVRRSLFSNQRTGGKWLVSKDGGELPLWSTAGRSLYFLSFPEMHIIAVDYEAKGDVFSAGKPRQWSRAPIYNPHTKHL